MRYQVLLCIAAGLSTSAGPSVASENRPAADLLRARVAEERVCGPATQGLNPKAFALGAGLVAIAAPTPRAIAEAEAALVGALSAAIILWAEPGARVKHAKPTTSVPLISPASTGRAADSALISRRDVEFNTSHAEWKGHRLTMLWADSPREGSKLVAVNISTVEGGAGRTSISWLPQPPGARGREAMLNLTSLEHLYAMTLATAAEGEFRFATGIDGADGSATSSQADVLRKIAAARQCIVGNLGWQAGDAVARWEVVLMESHETANHGDNDAVAVRVKSESGPLSGAHVSFARAPHSGCAAMSDAQGVAACTMQDLHMHGAHEDGHDAPVVATFRGNVGPAEIQLPTTLVLRRH
jgi:hypothetical protein